MIVHSNQYIASLAESSARRVIRKRGGFSLVEILIVISLFVVVSLIVGQALFSTIKGSIKSDLTIKVRQNGNYALSVMERKLHSALKVSCSDTNIISYNDANGVASRIACESSTLTDGPVGSTLPLLPSDVKVISCNFSCQTFAGIGTVSVNITFSNLTSSEAQQTSRTEEKVSVPLQTQIRLRN